MASHRIAWSSSTLAFFVLPVSCLGSASQPKPSASQLQWSRCSVTTQHHAQLSREHITRHKSTTSPSPSPRPSHLTVGSVAFLTKTRDPHEDHVLTVLSTNDEGSLAPETIIRSTNQRNFSELTTLRTDGLFPFAGDAGTGAVADVRGDVLERRRCGTGRTAEVYVFGLCERVMSRS